MTTIIQTLKVALGKQEHSFGYAALHKLSNLIRVLKCVSMARNAQRPANINHIRNRQQPASAIHAPLRKTWDESINKIICCDWMSAQFSELDDATRSASELLKLLLLRVCHGGVCEWSNEKS